MIFERVKDMEPEIAETPAKDRMKNWHARAAMVDWISRRLGTREDNPGLAFACPSRVRGEQAFVPDTQGDASADRLEDKSGWRCIV